MKNKPIYTCYGCPYYYTDKTSRYSVKHCGQDHSQCPYYWGKGEPLEKRKVLIMSKLMLDEAIEYAKEVAKEQKKDNEQCKYKSEYGCKGCVDYYTKPCVECAEEHEQLAEWLEELKALRHDANEWRKAGYAHGYSVGYNKAIDECYMKAKTLIDEMSYQGGRMNGRTHRMYCIQALEFLRQVAKELKAGVENE